LATSAPWLLAGAGVRTVPAVIAGVLIGLVAGMTGLMLCSTSQNQSGSLAEAEFPRRPIWALGGRPVAGLIAGIKVTVVPAAVNWTIARRLLHSTLGPSRVR
jgi:hypothetical protein